MCSKVSCINRECNRPIAASHSRGTKPYLDYKRHRQYTHEKRDTMCSKVSCINRECNRPIAASHSRGTKPSCWRAKVALGQDKQKTYIREHS